MKILSVVEADIPVNFQNWHSSTFQSYLRHGRRYAPLQPPELTNVAFKITRILSTVAVDTLINLRLWSCQSSVNFKTWHPSSFQSYFVPGGFYTSGQLLELTNIALRATKILSTVSLILISTVAFRTTKILSTVGVNVPVDYSIQNYENPINSKNRHSCIFQSYLTPEKRYISRQLPELKTVLFRATYKKKILCLLLTV